MVYEKFSYYILYKHFIKQNKGYEVHGLENIPKDGPALLIFYHSAVTMDFLFFAVHLYLKHRRKLVLVADTCLFKFPSIFVIF